MKRMELSKELKQQAIEDLKGYFIQNREEELGDLGAGLLLDFIIERIGPAVYNQAIQDAHAFMSEKVEELYALEKEERFQ